VDLYQFSFDKVDVGDTEIWQQYRANRLPPLSPHDQSHISLLFNIASSADTMWLSNLRIYKLLAVYFEGSRFCFLPKFKLH